MKKSLIAVLISAAAALSGAAQAQSYYAGADVGRAEQKFSADGVGSDKEHKTDFLVYGGYNFTKNYGVEGGYGYFGKTSVTQDGLSASIKPQTVYLAATGTLPLDPQFALFAKVGIAANRTKVTTSFEGAGSSDTENETTAMFGVGASYLVYPNTTIVVQYQNFGKVVKSDGADLKVNSFTVGARYAF